MRFSAMVFGLEKYINKHLKPAKMPRLRFHFKIYISNFNSWNLLFWTYRGLQNKGTLFLLTKQ